MPQHGRNRPKRNTLSFWHLSRADRIYPRIKSWPLIQDAIPVAFAGYKVGMTHLLMIETREGSHLKNEEVSVPVTILEVPPLKVFGIRLYKKTTNGYKTITDIIAKDINENLLRKIKNLNPKNSDKINEIEKYNPDLIKLLVHTQPYLTSIGKKKPEVFEIPIGGEINKAIDYAKNIFGKEIKITDVFKENELIDVIGVTKGHGFQGSVKRFGVKIIPRVNRWGESHRRVGSKGAWGMRRIFPTTPMPGQYGFFRRTEYNKLILKISDNPSEINPSSGWPHYGLVKNTWIAIKGSLFGPAKRLLILRKAIRPNEKLLEKEIKITQIVNSPKN